MFTMFGFGGAKCARCSHKSGAGASYCERCGMTLGAPRNEPVLRDNRWIAAPHELAVFFGMRELSGLFVKTLRVPAATRAYILQGQHATEVPQGEYELEGFFTRLNNLLRDQHAEILITRTMPLPVRFEFDDLETSEYLKLRAVLSIGIKVEQVPAFARHFMTLPGTITDAHLRELLQQPVRQLASEFLAGRSMRELSANRDLRAQLDERVQSALAQLLAQYGLAAVGVDTLELRHDKFDQDRQRIGSLWLAADERHVQLEHSKHLDQLYDEEEWQRIAREEQQARVRYRRAELEQDQAVGERELAFKAAERMHAVRAREIELYGRIVEANSRKEALDRGAGAVLADLEHDAARAAAERGTEALQWEHVRAMARIRMRTEMEAAQRDAQQARILERQRFSHQLLQQQVRNKVEQARLIEDESRKHAELASLREAEQRLRSHERDLELERQRAALESLQLANLARKREAERVAEWDEQQAINRKRELMRGEERKEALAEEDVAGIRRAGARAADVAQHEKLLRTIQADSAHLRAQQMVALEAEERRHRLRMQEQEAAWQHALKLQAHEITRMDAMSRASDTAKIALAAPANAGALADYLKTQVHASMSAAQLEALAGVAGAAASFTAGEALAMAEERLQAERGHAAAQADKDRAHQLGLLGLQNDVNKAALGTQAAIAASALRPAD
ncbi:SPFH domain-containing protein [Pseudoduganella sp. GCM10020061]|uniref:SPFH domain-containing protein n=1 Tax=Pseudoduganella sp. GCM10020061 TaxID=3317345 RepID=UPI0036342D39